jgi:hypothetical protein
MLECSVRAALIALGTAAVLGLLRVKSAGARHAAWTGVVAFMLLLPAWMAWGPRASLPVLPASPTPAAVSPMAISLAEPIAAMHATLPPHVPWNWLAMVYLSGVFLLLARLALGTLRAHLLTSACCVAPVTVGLLKPRIILPDSSRGWPPAQLEAVLAHEGAHVSRRDPLVQWLALLNRAIFWFHPLAWWLERHLSALAEEACDDAVLQCGHDPQDYSGYLLELARTVAGSGTRVKVVGMAMPGSSLPRRIRQILTSRPAPRLSRARAFCLAIACATLSTVFAAASVSRESFIPDPPLPSAPPAAPITKADPPQPPQKSESRRGEARYQDRRLFILYFDLDGAPADLQALATSAAAAFVKLRMQPDDLASIMSTSGGAVKVIEDFTDDRDKLTAALAKLDNNPAASPGGLDALLRATRMLSVLRAKKSLIYFAMPSLRESGSPEQLQAVVQAAQEADAAFYPIDAAGLHSADRK